MCKNQVNTCTGAPPRNEPGHMETWQQARSASRPAERVRTSTPGYFFFSRRNLLDSLRARTQGWSDNSETARGESVAVKICRALVAGLIPSLSSKKVALASGG